MRLPLAVALASSVLVGCAAAGTGGQGAPHAAPLPFIATGNEPGWRADLTESRLTVLADYGDTRVETDAPPARPGPDGTRYVAEEGGQRLELIVRAALCSDTMTGMPYPFEVTLLLGERQLEGCGGDPRTLLTGGPWRLRDPGNGDNPPAVELSFDEHGRLHGEGACHALRGAYTLTGEGLQLEPEPVPQADCSEARADLERRLLERLRFVYRFSLAADGALVLHAPDGELRAVR